MESSKEPIRARIARMNNLFIGRNTGQMKNTLAREGLLDALIVLYDECNSEALKKDPLVSAFVDKFRAQVADVRRLRVNITDFEVKNVIGRGHFGEVHVVKEKQTGDIYAMKTLRKADAINQRLAAFYEEERDIMVRASSPWLVDLQYAFQDMHNLYLVMEFQPGGDLRALLDRFGGSLGEEMAKFYVAEMTLAIHGLHSMGYVHRDVKPENVLLDRCGHVKLADFGSAAKLTGAGNVVSQLPVGTPDYISPEVLSAMEKQNAAGTSTAPTYGKECDFWSLGVVAYEMVLGATPFSGEKLTTTYRNIQTHKKSLQYPADSTVSECFKNLISGLLDNSTSRFGHTEITKHPFFVDVDWTGLLDVVPPFVPIVNGEDDTSNFIEFERTSPTPSIEHFKAKKDFSGRNLPFVGFTYAKDIGTGLLDKSLQQSGVVEHLESILSSKRKEVQELQAKIHMLENSEAPWRNREEVERRVEELSKRLELVEAERSRLEGELARAKSEQQSLRRALALERQEAKNMETRAMELIKCAKDKWDKERDEKDKQLERLTDKVTTLNTANNELHSKYHRRTKELQDLQTEMTELKEVVNGFRDKMAKTRQSKRDSMVSVENRLSQMASDNENQRVNLQERLNSECKKSAILEKDLREYICKITLLEEEARVESARTEAQRTELLREITVLRTQLAEGDKESSSDTMHSLESISSAEQMPRQAPGSAFVLDDIMSASTISFENHEITVQQREVENQLHDAQEELQQLREENSRFREALRKSADRNEELEQKLCSLEELMQKLESGLAQLEEENKQLREQNVALSRAAQKRRSSIVTPNTAVVSPRSSTTTTITTTVVATPSRTPTENKSAQEEESVKVELQVLAATVERLEAQLDKAKEAALVDRQAAQTAQTALWKKEKEVSNAKLDQRIAEREARTANETIKKMEEEKKNLLEEIEKVKEAEKEKHKADKEKLEKVSHDLLQLKVELRKEKNSAAALNDDLVKERDALNTANKKLAEAENRESTLRADLLSTRKELKLVQAQLISSQDEVKRLDVVCQEVRAEKRRLMQQLEAAQREMEGAQLSNKQLKDLCSVLDEQLEDFEKLTGTYSEKEAKLALDISRLQAEVEEAQKATKLAKQSLNEEKSLKIRAEARLPTLEAEISARADELAQVVKQRDEYKSLAEQLTQQVNSLEEKYSQQEVALHTYERQIANLKADILSLKEEATAHLTRIQSLKETNFRLDQELTASLSEERTLKERLDSLQANLAEVEECHAHKELKSSATLQQQSKLITYLQSKLEEQGRRKKTLTDKLFGRKDKENTSNNIMTPLKDLEGQLLLEKNKVNKLEQLIRAKSPPHANKEKEKEKTPPGPLLSPKTAKQLILSPGTQMTPDTLRRQPSLQRMHHNIPHRFEMKHLMKASKCSACQETLAFGRHHVCQECGVTAHAKCSAVLPSTCGLPSAFARHFSMSRRNKAKSNAIQETATAPTNLEGWLKLPKRGRSCWERRYVKLVGNELLIFDHEPTNPNLSPVERVNLCPSKGCTTVTGSVTAAEMSSTAKSDLPFIIKVDVMSATTCWPSSTQYLMVLNLADKEKWIEALKLAARSSCDEPEVTDSEAEAVENSKRYSGKVVVPTTQNLPLEVNCVTHMGTELVVLGTDKGLYSYRLNEEKGHPVKINGVSCVHQLLPIPHLKVAVMIAEKTMELFKCDLRLLQSCAAAAECTQANVALDPIPTCNTDAQDRCFQVLAVAKAASFSGTKDLLCAATPDKFYIFRWTPNTDSGNFELVKSLKTQEPCATILLRPHSIIVGCNKFFEIDAQDFTVEDFLDNAELALIHKANKKSGFPVAVLDVTTRDGPCSPEYLLCYHEMGIFVDGYGQRSREDCILWSRVPFTVGFREPYLYVVHFASVEVMLVTGSSFTRNLNDSGSTGTSSDTAVVSKFIPLNSPKLLGNAHAQDSVYVSNSTSQGAEVVCVSGHSAFKSRTEGMHRGKRSAASLHNDQDSEFSFTSSIVHSLDDQSSQLDSDDDIESTDQRDTDSTCDIDVPNPDRRVHFTSRPPHTAM